MLLWHIQTWMHHLYVENVTCQHFILAAGLLIIWLWWMKEQWSSRWKNTSPNCVSCNGWMSQWMLVNVEHAMVNCHTNVSKSLGKAKPGDMVTNVICYHCPCARWGIDGISWEVLDMHVQAVIKQNGVDWKIHLPQIWHPLLVTFWSLGSCLPFSAWLICQVQKHGFIMSVYLARRIVCSFSSFHLECAVAHTV